jgi:hypothetical protein
MDVFRALARGGKPGPLSTAASLAFISAVQKYGGSGKEEAGEGSTLEEKEQAGGLVRGGEEAGEGSTPEEKRQGARDAAPVAGAKKKPRSVLGSCASKACGYRLHVMVDRLRDLETRLTPKGQDKEARTPQNPQDEEAMTPQNSQDKEAQTTPQNQQDEEAHMTPQNQQDREVSKNMEKKRKRSKKEKDTGVLSSSQLRRLLSSSE